jgi:hypothetical protein
VKPSEDGAAARSPLEEKIGIEVKRIVRVVEECVS